jgi:hypothetical protein
MGTVPCFLCIKDLPKRIDKNRKPYFVCEPCGMQIFIRRKQGIEKLDELMRNLNEQDVRRSIHAKTLVEIQAILTELKGVKDEIKSIETGFKFLDSNKDEKLKKQTIKHLQSRIDNLLGQLAHIAHRGSIEKR